MYSYAYSYADYAKSYADYAKDYSYSYADYAYAYVQNYAYSYKGDYNYAVDNYAYAKDYSYATADKKESSSMYFCLIAAASIAFTVKKVSQWCWIVSQYIYLTFYIPPFSLVFLS